VFHDASSSTARGGAFGFAAAATDEVATKASSWGPACVRAELRMDFVPLTAGMMVEAQEVLKRLIGDAVWRIA
jgi:hypothetical protein